MHRHHCCTHGSSDCESNCGTHRFADVSANIGAHSVSHARPLFRADERAYKGTHGSWCDIFAHSITDQRPYQGADRTYKGTNEGAHGCTHGCTFYCSHSFTHRCANRCADRCTHGTHGCTNGSADIYQAPAGLSRRLQGRTTALAWCR
jgi:hypothetical protein